MYEFQHVTHEILCSMVLLVLGASTEAYLQSKDKILPVLPGDYALGNTKRDIFEHTRQTRARKSGIMPQSPLSEEHKRPAWCTGLLKRDELHSSMVYDQKSSSTEMDKELWYHSWYGRD